MSCHGKSFDEPHECSNIRLIADVLEKAEASKNPPGQNHVLRF
jgi:hypothetical protein